jgi:hypothetical protein
LDAIEIEFDVTDWRAWAPGLETRDAWRQWAAPAATTTSSEWSNQGLPAMLRRRVGPLGQRAIAAALGCEGVARSRYVFASRHGELGRTVGILGTVAKGETPSPTEFSMSVHHALAGLLSIHAENREGHTAVVAGVDTFGFGFLEAASFAVTESKPALLVYYDASLPEEYQEFDDPRDVLPLVAAIQIEPASGNVARFSFSASAPAGGPRNSDVRTTQAPRDFLRFLISGADTAVSAGDRMTWRWHRVR